MMINFGLLGCNSQKNYERVIFFIDYHLTLVLLVAAFAVLYSMGVSGLWTMLSSQLALAVMHSIRRDLEGKLERVHREGATNTDLSRRRRLLIFVVVVYDSVIALMFAGVALFFVQR